MQWSDGKNLGFSNADSEKLYLPIDSAEDAPNVEMEEKDPNSLLNFVRELIRLKKNEPALAAYAEFVPVYAKEDTYPFIFARAADNDVVLAVFNPGPKKETAEFSLNIKAAGFNLLSGDESEIKIDGNKYNLEIDEQSYSIYKIRK